MAAGLEDGGGTGKDRGGDLGVRGPLSASGKYSTPPPALASLVDEAETTEVELTHD